MRTILGVISLFLLALFCIGIAELSVARFEDPELYESVAAPAREAYQDVRTQVDDYMERREEERRLEEQRRLEEEQRRLEEERRAEIRRRQEEERLRREEEQRRAEELAAQEASAPIFWGELNLADPTITEFTEEDGREVLTGGNVRLFYYNQGDEAWADKPFGSDRIGGYGCGPTALAMAVSSMTEENADPAEVALWAVSAGCWASRSGSRLSIVEAAAEHYGLVCESLGAIDAHELYGRLSEGGVIVALMGPGHFTGRGHFILLHGSTLSGSVLVADPNSRENSLAEWDPQLIVDELSRSRHDGAPLWLLNTQPSL